MIYIDTIENPSAHVVRRAALMWTQKIADRAGILAYRVTPHGTEFDHKSKAKRIVTVDLLRGTAACVEKHSGLPCQANADYVIATGESKTPRLCSHVLAVLQRVAINQQRKQRAA